jgi:ATP-dependent DNA helicase PIF1
MSKLIELYALLGIKYDNKTVYPVEAIKMAYHSKAKSVHPDKGGDPELFKKINEAYTKNAKEKTDFETVFSEADLPENKFENKSKAKPSFAEPDFTKQTLPQFNFTKRQKEAFEAMIKGKNILLTGPSGTGKSKVVNTFKEMFGKNKFIATTSTTGISAILVGGTTIHSFLGIGLGTGSVEDLTSIILKNSKVRQRWLSIDVLIIDEISMMSPELFDKLEEIARNIRCPRRLLAPDNFKQTPFGGIQLILSGDFLQLPVIGSNDFCFEAKSWSSCIEKTIVLNEIIRQNDMIFQTVLNEIRFGELSKESEKILKKRVNVKLKTALDIKPIQIYTTNGDVDYLNERELDKLAEKGLDFYEYNMEVYFYEFVKDRERALEKCKKNCLAPDKLQLCVGTQVMLLCNFNIEAGLANGSMGIVTRFECDIPVVKFSNGLETAVDYWTWSIEEDKKKTVTIKQIPLRLAYAITVHKSQGSTIDYAEVNLDNVFAYGQVYVALSRVKTLSGLNIRGIDFKGIKAHPKALEFYRSLEES